MRAVVLWVDYGAYHDKIEIITQLQLYFVVFVCIADVGLLGLVCQLTGLEHHLLLTGNINLLSLGKQTLNSPQSQYSVSRLPCLIKI